MPVHSPLNLDSANAGEPGRRE